MHGGMLLIIWRQEASVRPVNRKIADEGLTFIDLRALDTRGLDLADDLSETGTPHQENTTPRKKRARIRTRRGPIKPGVSKTPIDASGEEKERSIPGGRGGIVRRSRSDWAKLAGEAALHTVLSGESQSEGTPTWAQRYDGKRYLEQRPPPRLARLRDGYAYEGGGLEARILRDGRVRFGSFDGELDLRPEYFEMVDPKTGEPLSSAPGNQTLGGRVATFSVSNLIERASGNDPFLAEKKWFLESTQALREKMRAKHQKKMRALAVIKTRTWLQKIWSRRDLSKAERRKMICQRFIDTVDGRGGAKVKRAILSWIAQALPQNAKGRRGNAFTVEEIAACEKRNPSKQRFRPYK